MAERAAFTIGAQANCTDGGCGHLTRVIVDPVARALTHLVIRPPLGQGLDRLVPIDLAEAGPGEVRLRCTRAEFDQLDPAEETGFCRVTTVTSRTGRRRRARGPTTAWAAPP